MDGFDFSVAQGIARLFPTVSAPTHNLSIAHDDAAHRHFPIVGRFFGQLQRHIHKFSICHMYHPGYYDNGNIRPLSSFTGTAHPSAP